MWGGVHVSRVCRGDVSEQWERDLGRLPLPGRAPTGRGTGRRSRLLLGETRPPPTGSRSSQTRFSVLTAGLSISCKLLGVSLSLLAKCILFFWYFAFGIMS